MIFCVAVLLEFLLQVIQSKFGEHLHHLQCWIQVAWVHFAEGLNFLKGIPSGRMIAQTFLAKGDLLAQHDLAAVGLVMVQSPLIVINGGAQVFSQRVGRGGIGVGLERSFDFGFYRFGEEQVGDINHHAHAGGKPRLAKLFRGGFIVQKHFHVVANVFLFSECLIRHDLVVAHLTVITQVGLVIGGAFDKGGGVLAESRPVFGPGFIEDGDLTEDTFAFVFYEDAFSSDGIAFSSDGIAFLFDGIDEFGWAWVF